MADTGPKPFVFVLMPFREDFNDIYALGIKAACDAAGAYCERVDEQIFMGSILERVYNQISKADVIVADMTGHNPNVFYEVGYAHALNKRVVLLAQESGDIPFDLKPYPHIVYGKSIQTLKAQLEPRIRWCIENPAEPLSTVDVSLDVFVNGTQLQEGAAPPGIKVRSRPSRNGQVLTIGIHNRGSKPIGPTSFGLALVMPPGEIQGENVVSTTELPDEQYMASLSQQYGLFPDGWHTFEVTILPFGSVTPLNFILRVFTEVGPRDYPFRLD